MKEYNTMLDINEANRRFDEYIIRWVEAMKRLPYSEEMKRSIWEEAQRDWVEMSEKLYKFGLLRLKDKMRFENHAIYVTNKLIGDLVETSYDMSKDSEMSRIFPHIDQK